MKGSTMLNIDSIAFEAQKTPADLQCESGLPITGNRVSLGCIRNEALAIHQPHRRLSVTAANLRRKSTSLPGIGRSTSPILDPEHPCMGPHPTD